MVCLIKHKQDIDTWTYRICDATVSVHTSVCLCRSSFTRLVGLLPLAVASCFLCYIYCALNFHHVLLSLIAIEPLMKQNCVPQNVELI